MSEDLILTNAVLVLPDAQRLGTLIVHRGKIAEIADGATSVGGAIDLQGDYLIPGLVDLHTDNLERQVLPRSNARWPSRSAFLAHDAHCAAAGITTVLDALCIGDVGLEAYRLQTCTDGMENLAALAPTGLLKSEHYLHLRCEIPGKGMLDLARPLLASPFLRLVSMMDHTPGGGQFADVERWRSFRRHDGFSDAEIDATLVEMREMQARFLGPNRTALIELLAGTGVAVASHDDRTAAEVAELHALGVTIAEFPVSLEAARAAKSRGMAVIAGAPNLVRGGSHSGNVAVADLVHEGLADALASDYVPASMVEAAFACATQGLVSLPDAVAMVSANPAHMAGFADRGRLVAGLRADLVRVHLHENMPVVRQVWQQGARVI